MAPRALRDLSLNAKVTLTLTAVFAAIVAAFLVFLVPFLREQRANLLEKDKRLLSTLRDSYQREFIYDLLSENEESLGAHLADLAGQSGLLWARVEAGATDLAATAERGTIRRLLGEEAAAFETETTLALLLWRDGRADLVSTGGRPLLAATRVNVDALPIWTTKGPPGPSFEEVRWNGQTVLYFTTELAASGEHFGRLHLLYSLAHLRRSDALTNTLLYGVTGAAFVLLLLLLNLLISRIVIGPVQSLQQAMSRAATGDLEVRLPVHSRDELGAMADAFNRMGEQLAGSRREVEDYSRNLESMVAARTAALQESEKSLLDLKNRLATVIASVATGVIALDEAGRIETFNERAAEILGVPDRDVEGRPLEEVLTGDRRRIVELVEATRRGEAPRQEAQFVCRLPQGRRTLSVVASAFPGERNSVVVVCEDLTQILATQRLEAWKEAVERVIHEIKNPLTPVGLAAETLKSAHERDREKFDALFPSAIEMVLSSVRSLKELISEFGRFSRLPEMQLERCRPNELVRTALEPYVHGGLGGVSVRVDLADGLPEVEADPAHLKRVLLNVVNNALEAMEGRTGELRVATAATPAGVLITIADEGPGVEDVERIFEPHYTTKVKGTGLGLAIARQIVDEHRGRITVESAVGRGATVRIELPAAAG